MNICKLCEKEYEHKHNNGNDKYCVKCYFLIYRLKIKKKCVNYKGGECEACGYNKSLRALSFHHVNPNTKSFGISDNLYRKWEKIIIELDKCILLCMNCHAELHAKNMEDKNGM